MTSTPCPEKLSQQSKFFPTQSIKWNDPKQCNENLNLLWYFQDYEYEEDPNAIEGLPASAADLLDKPYDDGFNCDQQDAGYGYYADTLNDCKVRRDFEKTVQWKNDRNCKCWGVI